MKPSIALWMTLEFLAPHALAADLNALDGIPDFVEVPATKAILKQLRLGGYVLYMRHGNTDTTRPDRLPSVDLNDCATQRPLTAEGRRTAASVGKEIRRAGIPLGEIFSSPLCRAKESAEAAFGKKFTVNTLLMYTANMTNLDKKPALEETRELISKPVTDKTNRVLVAHAPNLMDILGYFPKPEGTVVIFKPLGNKNFRYIASIAPKQWSTLQP